MSSQSKPGGDNNIGILALLCDSRTCNQMGGGEHLKPDIEDLLQLATATSQIKAKVSLATCYGLCNRAPNMKLKSRGGNYLYEPSFNSNGGKRRGQKLRNDGGLRMRVDDDEHDATARQEDEMEAVNRTIISSITMTKLARALGGGTPTSLLTDAVVRALEHKTKGNKCFRGGNYEDALQEYIQGRQQLSINSSSNSDSDHPSVQNFYASLWHCSSKTRVQLALNWCSAEATAAQPDKTSEEAIDELLKVAAGDLFRVLEATMERKVGVAHDINDDDYEELRAVIAKLVTSDAGLETKKRIEAAGLQEEYVPAANDTKSLIQLCITLGDAWSSLVADPFVRGAVEAYGGVLDVASRSKSKRLLLRAKDRRRIEAEMEALSSS